MLRCMSLYPHTAIHVSSYNCTCVRILLCVEMTRHLARMPSFCYVICPPPHTHHHTEIDNGAEATAPSLLASKETIRAAAAAATKKRVDLMRKEEVGQQLQQQGGALQLAKPASTRRSSHPKNRGRGEGGWGALLEGRADSPSASFQESSDPGSMNGGWHASSSYY